MTNHLKLSAAGAKLIAGFEGFRANWYDDGTGVQTIGYGHTGKLPKGFAAPLSPQQGLALLAIDAETASNAVNGAVKVSLGTIPAHAQARFDACVSLAFNIGGGGFAGSTLVKEINKKGAPRDWETLEPFWLEWDRAGGRVLPGLLTRRKAEFKIFASGVY